MFTGIVETLGCIVNCVVESECTHFTIQPETPYRDLTVGESIAINGTCLTVTQFDDKTFNVTAVPETLKRTNLGALTIGSHVNLERAMTLQARLGGHFVQGHVDTTAEIIDIEKGDAWLVKMRIAPEFSKYIVSKGYITIDGMSITIVDCGKDWFTVTFIPHTQAVTITQQYALGQRLNIEVDMMAKYIEKFMGAYAHANSH